MGVEGLDEADWKREKGKGKRENSKLELPQRQAIRSSCWQKESGTSNP
jgi:hypothetical protein